MSTNTIEKNLINEFAKDINCLDPIYKELSDINCFEILKIDQMEIRHSNFLAWLLDPNSPSGIGDKLLKRLLMFCSDNSDKGLGSKKEMDAVSIELFDIDDVVTKREHLTDIKGRNKPKQIDLLIYSEKNKFCICIENKINSNEGVNQLHDYFVYMEDSFARKQTTTNKSYKYNKRYYVLLSPTGIDADKAEDRKNWIALSYADVYDWIHKIRETYEKEIPIKAQNIIDDYLNALRRHVIEGDFKKTCEEIYMRHPGAFSYFENHYKGKDVTEKQESQDEYKLYNKHRDAINLVLDNKTKLTEKVKLRLVEALEESGCKVQYDTKRAPVYIKVPATLTDDERLVNHNIDDICSDFLFYELYYAPGEKCYYVYLRCQLNNSPAGFDASVYGKEISKRSILHKRINKKSTSAYIDDITTNPREPSKDDAFVRELCNEVRNAMNSKEAKECCREILNAIR